MMNRRLALGAIILALSAAAAGIFLGNAGTLAAARIFRLEPDTGIPGDTVTAFGERLDSSKVGNLSLTDGTVQVLVHIAQQSETFIRFRIPVMLSPGKYRVVIHPAGRFREGIEQQVTLTVS